MRKNIILVMLVLLVTALGTGCWDTMDISNRAFVTAIGIDTGETSKKFKVSLEIVKPAQLLKWDTQDNAAFVETIEADSMAVALDEIQGRIPRLLSLAHLQVVLIGEKLARENFRDTIEFIQKSPEKALRLNLMFVYEGEALDVLKAKPMLGPYIAEELIEMTRMEGRHAMMYTNPLISLIGDMRVTGGRGMGTMVAVSERGHKIIQKGSAIFDKWKLIGWLDGQETKEANWLVDNADTTILVTGNGGKYAYRVNQSKLSIKPDRNGQGELKFIVRLKTNGMIIDEQEKDYDLTKPKEMNKMEKIFSQKITEEIQVAIHKSQKEFGVDYLGFGEVLKRNDLETYKKLDWEKLFPDIPIDVQVNASVTRFGLSP